MGIRLSYDRLISTMGFPMPVRWHIYIESGLWLSAGSSEYDFSIQMPLLKTKQKNIVILPVVATIIILHTSCLRDLNRKYNMHKWIIISHMDCGDVEFVLFFTTSCERASRECVIVNNISCLYEVFFKAIASVILIP